MAQRVLALALVVSLANGATAVRAESWPATITVAVDQPEQFLVLGHSLYLITWLPLGGDFPPSNSAFRRGRPQKIGARRGLPAETLEA